MEQGIVGMLFGVGVTFLLCTTIYAYRFADDVRRGREVERERREENAKRALETTIRRTANSLLEEYGILDRAYSGWGYSVAEPLNRVLNEKKEV